MFISQTRNLITAAFLYFFLFLLSNSEITLNKNKRCKCSEQCETSATTLRILPQFVSFKSEFRRGEGKFDVSQPAAEQSL